MLLTGCYFSRLKEMTSKTDNRESILGESTATVCSKHLYNDSKPLYSLEILPLYTLLLQEITFYFYKVCF